MHFEGLRPLKWKITQSAVTDGKCAVTCIAGTLPSAGGQVTELVISKNSP